MRNRLKKNHKDGVCAGNVEQNKHIDRHRKDASATVDITFTAEVFA